MAHRSTSQTLVGVAFYNQPNLQYPRWALVLHGKHYDSKRARVYQIRKRNNDDWALDHQICHLTDLGDLIGVLHLTVSPYDINFLDEIIRAYPAGKESFNPGQVFAWSPSGWVIRALSDMHDDGFAVIPGKFRARTFWQVASDMCFALREEPGIRERVPITLWPTT